MNPANPPTSVLPETVDESTVRRLCGAAVFAEAEKLQGEGHVLGPTLGEHGPEASVRGTWRRVDHIAVQFKTGRLSPSCTRDGDVFCRHVGALLLQCLRDPDSLSAPERTDDVVQTMPPSYGALSFPHDADETPAAELARLLERDTANHLRQITRRRGARLSGNRKTDIVQQLTSALAEPANVDAAIAGLSRSERLALDATHLVSAETPASEEAVRQGIRPFRGTEAPPSGGPDGSSLDTLLDAGLVMLASHYAYGPEGFVVPRAVAARLPALNDLARHAGDAPIGRSSDNAPRLGIIETIQVMAQASLVDRIRLRPRTKKRDRYDYTPPGFVFDLAEQAEHVPMLGQAQPDGVRLLPPRLLADADLDRLADRTGQPVEAVEFVARLLLALQIAQTSSGAIAIRFDRLQALLDLPPQECLARLAHAWLLTAGPAVLDVLFGPNGELAFRWQPAYTGWLPPLPQPLVSATRLIARLVGRMSPAGRCRPPCGRSWTAGGGTTARSASTTRSQSTS